MIPLTPFGLRASIGGFFFHLGTIVLREKLARGRIRISPANVPRCLIGIEAGMGTHYVARELIAIGHDVSQVPPAYAEDLLVIGERPTTETASF